MHSHACTQQQQQPKLWNTSVVRYHEVYSVGLWLHNPNKILGIFHICRCCSRSMQHSSLSFSFLSFRRTHFFASISLARTLSALTHTPPSRSPLHACIYSTSIERQFVPYRCSILIVHRGASAPHIFILVEFVWRISDSENGKSIDFTTISHILGPPQLALQIFLLQDTFH